MNSTKNESLDTDIPHSEANEELGDFKAENQKRPQFGNRFLREGDDVYRYNVWDDVKWDEEQEKKAVEVVAKQLENKISLSEYKDIEQNASVYWNDFYNVHSNRFYKNRNWIFTEFPELNDKNATSIFEIGCGVGNTVFPILLENPDPNLLVYCCDFSSSAISILKENPNFESRCIPFVCDLTQSEWNLPFEENTIDIMLMVFVLSSIPPNKVEYVVKKLYRYLKPGGLILLRDYGRYDLSQLRFRSGNCIGENYYVRGEKTLVYFFSREELNNTFTKCGYEVIQNRVDQRLQTNRKRKLKMYRIWIQGKFRKPLS